MFSSCPSSGLRLSAAIATQTVVVHAAVIPGIVRLVASLDRAHLGALGSLLWSLIATADFLPMSLIVIDAVPLRQTGFAASFDGARIGLRPSLNCYVPVPYHEIVVPLTVPFCMTGLTASLSGTLLGLMKQAQLGIAVTPLSCIVHLAVTLRVVGFATALDGTCLGLSRL